MKRNEIDRDKLSPGMKQYIEIKDNYEEELLFFRLEISMNCFLRML